MLHGPPDLQPGVLVKTFLFPFSGGVSATSPPCEIATWLIMDDLKCGVCLELFQDPRSLPCLHTFCRECIQRSLNDENHSLKCPVCRAKHELSEGAELLPVNQYALQEEPLKRLQQQREDNGGPHKLVECKSCGEQAGSMVACVRTVMQ